MTRLRSPVPNGTSPQGKIHQFGILRFTLPLLLNQSCIFKILLDGECPKLLCPSCNFLGWAAMFWKIITCFKKYYLSTTVFVEQPLDFPSLVNTSKPICISQVLWLGSDSMQPVYCFHCSNIQILVDKTN